MRAKYESLALVQLKELAKIRGIKGASVMKKAELVEAMLLEDEKDKDKAANADSIKMEVVKAKSVREESAKEEPEAEGEKPAQEITEKKQNRNGKIYALNDSHGAIGILSFSS